MRQQRGRKKVPGAMQFDDMPQGAKPLLTPIVHPSRKALVRKGRADTME